LPVASVGFPVTAVRRQVPFSDGIAVVGGHLLTLLR